MVLALPEKAKQENEGLAKLLEMISSSSSSSEEQGVARSAVPEEKGNATSSSEELTNAEVEEMRVELAKAMPQKDADNIADFFKKFTNEATSDETAEGVVSAIGSSTVRIFFKCANYLFQMQILALVLAKQQEPNDVKKDDLLKLFTDSKEEKVNENVNENKVWIQWNINWLNIISALEMRINYFVSIWIPMKNPI